MLLWTTGAGYKRGHRWKGVISGNIHIILDWKIYLDVAYLHGRELPLGKFHYSRSCINIPFYSRLVVYRFNTSYVIVYDFIFKVWGDTGYWLQYSWEETRVSERDMRNPNEAHLSQGSSLHILLLWGHWSHNTVLETQLWCPILSEDNDAGKW